MDKQFHPTLYTGCDYLLGSNLTHWGRVTHICVGKLIIIGSDNGLSPGRRQAIVWTSAWLLSIGPLGTKSVKFFMKIPNFSFKKIYLNISSAKWRSYTYYCLSPHTCICVNEPLPLQWRHNEHDSVSNHQPHDCLLNRLFRRRSKKTSKLRVTGLCAGNSPGTNEFPAQMVSNAESVCIWWRHHAIKTKVCETFFMNLIMRK